MKKNKIIFLLFLTTAFSCCKTDNFDGFDFGKLDPIPNFKREFKHFNIPGKNGQRFVGFYKIENNCVYLVKKAPINGEFIFLKLFSFNDNKGEKKLVKIEISGVSNPPFAYNYYITTHDTINEKERYIIKYIFGPDMEGRGQRDFGSELDSSCFVIKELEYIIDSGFTRINVFKYSDSCKYNYQTW